jgi:hypothetical protein
MLLKKSKVIRGLDKLFSGQLQGKSVPLQIAKHTVESVRIFQTFFTKIDTVLKNQVAQNR